MFVNQFFAPKFPVGEDPHHARRFGHFCSVCTKMVRGIKGDREDLQEEKRF